MSQFSTSLLVVNQGAIKHPMVFYNLYRFIIACAFISYYFLPKSESSWSSFSPEVYIQIALGYAFIALTGLVLAAFDKFRHRHQLSLYTVADIVFIVLLTFAAGGLKTGLGMLLVVAIALSSLFSNGRLALFYAALATIALLLEQSFQSLSNSEGLGDYSQAVMLSVSCFATAWLAHSLAQRTLTSEAILSKQQVDLANLEQVNALITQEMQDGVVVVDHAFVVRHMNAQAEYLLGVSAYMWLGHALGKVAPKLTTMIHTWMNEATEQSDPVKFTHEERALQFRFMPVSEDRKSGAVVFIEDWSQIQTQSHQVKLAALGRLTANIAHEIRNPLSAISHATELLQEEATNPTDRRMLQIIADNVLRLDQIVKDVLELNRRDRTQQEVIEMRAFLTEFHEQFCLAEKIPLEAVQLVMASETLEIRFDRRHLNQIIWNLCRNAWRHSQQQAESVRVTLITTANKNRPAMLSVEDDGPGVPEPAVAHLFEPFFTTESTGTGLGLYIARELCEANSSRIEYNRGERGAQFTLYLKKLTSTKQNDD